MSRFHRALDRRRWELARLRAMERDGWRCSKCGKAGRLEVHHRVHLRDGGEPFALENLVTRCRPCHFGEHASQDPATVAWRSLVAEKMAE